MSEPLAIGADRLVSQKEAAKILGLGVSTLRAKRDVPYVEQRGSRSGGRKIRRYLLSDLYAYIQARRVDPAEKKAS